MCANFPFDPTWIGDCLQSFELLAIHFDDLSGWLNRGEKTGDTGVNPVLIGEGLKHLGLGVALVQEGFNNLLESLGHGAIPSEGCCESDSDVSDV